MSKDVKKTKTPVTMVEAFVFNDKDELLLLRTERSKEKYVCPGGHVKYKETLVDALKRGVKEKTGMSVFDIDFLQVGEDLKPDKKYRAEDGHHVYINYRAKAKNPAKMKPGDEVSDYQWRKVDEWKQEENLAPNIVDALEEFSKDSFEARYKRALADYQNLLKQSAKDKQDFARYANENLLQLLLPVYDNLKTSLEHTDESIEDSPWLEGVKYVVKQFNTALTDSGVEEIETEGKDFDPHTMEAMSGQGDKVKKEIRPGYKLNGKVITPARVELE